MLSSLKKTSDKPSVVVPAWHPNFRNVERLPDIKVVRTSFFVNGLAIFIALTLATYTTYREYGLSALRSETAIALNDIQRDKPASEQAVVLFKKFQEEEKKVLALQEFLSGSRLVVSDFILQLGANLPRSVSLYSIDCKSTVVTLRGGIEGAADEASGRANAYVEELRKNAIFSALFENVTLSNIARDPSTGKIQFVIDLKVKSSTKTAAGGKK